MLSKKWVHISLFSFFLILVFLSRVTGIPRLSPDSYTYMATADALLRGNWYLEMWGRVPTAVSPLYPLLIALGKSWFGIENNVAAFLISVVSSMLLVLIVFLWAARRFGWGWAWVAASFVVFNFSLMFYGNAILTEPLFILLFFTVAGLSWVILCQKSHPLLYLIVGIIMGLAIITKGSALMLPVILLCWIIIRVLSGDMTVKRALTVGVLAIIGVLLVTQPVAWKSNIPGGGGESTGKKSLVSMLSKPDLRKIMDRERYAAELNPAGDEFKMEVSQGETTTNLMISRGPEILRIIVINFGLGINSLFIVVPWWLLIWIPVGIWIQWMRGDKGGFIFSVYLLTISVGLIGLYSLAEVYTATIGPERYTTPLIPFMILLVTSGLRVIHHEVYTYCNVRKLPFSSAGIGIVLLLIVLVFFSSFSLGKTISFAPNDKRWIRSGSQMIGEEIRRNVGPGHRIMARDPSIPYYADGLWVLTPFEPLDRVIAFAQRKKVRLIIVRKKMEGSVRPQLIPLLEKDFNYPGLHRVIEIPSYQNDGLMELAIYEINY